MSTRKSELTRQAARLFAEKGYHGTSIGDLAAALGVQKGSLYAHIDSKEDLLWEVAREGAEAFHAALAFEVPPLADEDRRDVELLGDDAEMSAQRRPDSLHDRPLVRHLVEREMERLGALAGDVPEQVGFRLDVRVQRALLDAERFGEIAHGRAVVALLGEEPGGGAG